MKRLLVLSLLLAAACDSPFFEYAKISRPAECPDLVPDVRFVSDGRQVVTCETTVTDVSTTERCDLHVELRCATGDAELSFEGAADGAEASSEIYTVRLVERMPLPFQQTNVIGWTPHEVEFEPATLGPRSIMGHLRRGYYEDLLEIGTDLITTRSEPVYIVPVCPWPAATRLGDPRSTREVEGPPCLLAAAAIDGGFVAVFGDDQLYLGRFEGSDLTFALTASTAIDFEADCGHRPPDIQHPLRLRWTVPSLRTDEDGRRAVLTFGEATAPAIVDPSLKGENLSGYVMVVDITDLSVPTCRFFDLEDDKAPLLRDAHFIEDGVIAFEESNDLVYHLDGNTLETRNTVELSATGRAPIVPEIAIDGRDVFAADLRDGAVIMADLVEYTNKGGAAPLGDASGMLVTTLTKVGQRYAVGLYERLNDGASPERMGNAAIGWFDPVKRRFLPDATWLEIPDYDGPTGAVGRIRVSPDGRRIHALLTWAGAVVELESVE